MEEDRSIDLEDGVVLLRRDGTEIPIGDSTAPVRDRDGEILGVVMVLRDESERRRVGHQLSHEASHDALTGLINRREFERRLKRVLGDLTVAPSEHALLYLDLDRFKLINDICGHEAGDAVLQGLGTRLGRRLRKRDTLARLGGDEFGVLLEHCPLLEAERIAENLRVEIEGYRFEWAGQAFSIGVSIGLFPVTGENGGIDAVLRAADAACYSAKECGGNRVRLEWGGRDSTKISHPMAGPYLRLTKAIDEWVVRETTTMLGRWQKEHPDNPLPTCCINLSASSLVDDHLLPFVERQLTDNGVLAETLCFEIAESAALANLPQAVRFFAAIRGIGCGIRSGCWGLATLRGVPWPLPFRRWIRRASWACRAANFQHRKHVAESL